MSRLKEVFSVRYHQRLKMMGNDMAINTIATILPIFVLQLAILPFVARQYDENQYGLMLTLISLITLAAQPLGNTLNNTRLLLNHEYDKNNVKGDFNILLLFYSIVNIIVTITVVYFYEGFFSIVPISLITVISVSQLLRSYLLVAFTLKIDYKSVLYCNIILVSGYLLGTIFFALSGLWQLIYVVGEIGSLMYLIGKTDLLKEPVRATKKLKKITRHGAALLVAGFLGTLISQSDRLLLFPLLGGEMVAVYYVSILFGKIMSMLVGPVSDVILTYVSRMTSFEVSNFKKILLVSSIMSCCLYAIILVISEPALRVLYPMYADEAMKLIHITTATALVMMVSSVANPLLMKFCSINWQVVINIVNVTVYILLSYILVASHGIYGFCFAALITFVVKLILQVLIYVMNYKPMVTVEN